MQLSNEDYQQWLERAVTELWYWTATQPKIKQDIQENQQINNEDCFAVHVNQKKLPEFLFDDTTVLEHLQYPKSFIVEDQRGETHNTLGMYNGTFPLLALINFMILFNTRLNEDKT
jgi:hypothetical protein